MFSNSVRNLLRSENFPFRIEREAGGRMPNRLRLLRLNRPVWSEPLHFLGGAAARAGPPKTPLVPVIGAAGRRQGRQRPA